MSEPAPPDPYAALVGQVLAGEVEPEVAGVEAVDLMEKLKRDGPTGFSLSLLGLNDSDAARLTRFARAFDDELMRRLASDPEAV